MSTSRLVHHAQVVWRSERIIAELRLKRLLGNLGLQALAALVLTFGGEKFEPGESLSVREADGVNLHRVVSVLPL